MTNPQRDKWLGRLLIIALGLLVAAYFVPSLLPR